MQKGGCVVSDDWNYMLSFIKTAEAAERLGLNPATVRDWVKAGRLVGITIKRRTWVGATECCAMQCYGENLDNWIRKCG